MEQYKDSELQKHYKAGLKFQNEMGFTSAWPEYERFLAGQQWNSLSENSKAKNLPRPTFNIIAHIQNHKKANVQGESIKMVFTPEELAQEGISPEIDMARQGAEKFTNLASSTWERVKLDKLNDEMLTGCCNIGTGIIHFFWNNLLTGGITTKYVGDFEGEILDPSNVFFANPQQTELQRQPYILISSREIVKMVKNEALKNGVPDFIVETIGEDKNLSNEIYDSAKKEMSDTVKTNILTEYYKKDGTVHFKRVCGDIVITPETNTGLRRYPLALMNWKLRKKNIYGIGETEGLIPNQKAINLGMAMALMSSQQNAVPKVIAKAGALKQPITNKIGEVITDYSINGDGIKYLKGEGYNPASVNLIEQFINYTKDLNNASETSMGSVSRETSASAIMLLQKASGVSLDDVKARYYRYLEDVARIWLDFWVVKYNMIRPVRMETSEGIEYTDYIVGTDYADFPFWVKIDIGSSSIYSESMAQGTLDKLLQMGAIDVLTYIKYSSPNTIPHKESLYKDVQMAQMQMLQSQQMMGGMPQGNPSPTSEFSPQEDKTMVQGNERLGIKAVEEPSLNRIRPARDLENLIPGAV